MDYKITYIRDGKVRYFKTAKSYAGWHIRRWKKLLALYMQGDSVRPNLASGQNQ